MNNDNAFLQKQIDALQKKVDAICEYYGICLEYQPDAYTVSEVEKEEADEPAAK